MKIAMDTERFLRHGEELTWQRVIRRAYRAIMARAVDTTLNNPNYSTVDRFFNAAHTGESSIASTHPLTVRNEPLSLFEFALKGTRIKFSNEEIDKLYCNRKIPKQFAEELKDYFSLRIDRGEASARFEPVFWRHAICHDCGGMADELRTVMVEESVILYQYLDERPFLDLFPIEVERGWRLWVDVCVRTFMYSKFGEAIFGEFYGLNRETGWLVLMMEELLYGRGSHFCMHNVLMSVDQDINIWCTRFMAALAAESRVIARYVERLGSMGVETGRVRIEGVRVRTYPIPDGEDRYNSILTVAVAVVRSPPPRSILSIFLVACCKPW